MPRKMTWKERALDAERKLKRAGELSLTISERGDVVIWDGYGGLACLTVPLDTLLQLAAKARALGECVKRKS